jgi:hypothetical protein
MNLQDIIKQQQGEARGKYVKHSPEIGDYIDSLEARDIDTLISQTVHATALAVVDDRIKDLEVNIISKYRGFSLDESENGFNDGLKFAIKKLQSLKAEVTLNPYDVRVEPVTNKEDLST